MPRLVIEKGSDKGKYLEVSERGTLLIGRDSSANLRLADTMASRLHFRLEYREDGIWLCDLKSMNGTYVNGERVQEARLKPGDRVQVGETLFTYMADEEAAGLDSFVGKAVGGYRVLERVGRGGMGTVYKAEQLSLKRIVAIKVIATEHTRDKTFMDLFLREARAAAQLNHPNIVQVYDAKGFEGTYFYSMEFVPNGSVQDLLSKEKKVSPDRAARVTLDAARGLEYAERKAIVHRDIKPDNLMIGEMGAIKIGDLGLAQRLNDAVPVEESRTVLGTPHYIAPEQVLGKPADHRSDIYALGATLYRMLAGTTPYTGANVREIVQRKVREDPPPLHEVDAEVPPALSEIARKMMVREPDERYQKVGEVVAALEGFLAAPPATTLAEGAQPAPRRGALWIGIGAAAAVALGVGAALLFRKHDPGAAASGAAPPPVVVSPSEGPSQAEEDLAQEYLRQAKDADKQLRKDSSEDTIRKVIGLYERIPEKCPRSARVADARERVQALQGMLAEAAARAALREAERGDAESFVKLSQAARPGPPDAAAVHAAVAASDKRYGEVEQKHPGSEAAARARQFRDHLKQWQARVDAALARCAATAEAVRKEAEASRFGAASDLWKAFADECRDKALASPFGDGRYGDLLIASAAEARRRELDAAAADAFQRVQDEANALVAQDKFDDAKASYRRAAETIGLPAVADRARLAIAAIDRKIVEKLDRDRREAEERERRRVLEDEKRLAQALQAAQEPLKRYDFRRAADAFKAGAAALDVDKNRTAAAHRLQDLEAMARLKAEFIRRASLPGATREFVRAIKTKSRAGDITGATDEAMTITVAVDRGKAEMVSKWTEFAQPDFCALFRKRWSLTAADLLGLGCLYQEFGLFPEAEDLFKQAQSKATDAATRDAAARHLEEVRGNRGGGGTRDDEADSRWKRAKVLAEQKRYADAKAECDTLLSDFSDTPPVRNAQAEIETLLKDVAAKADDEEKHARRAQIAQRYPELKAAELKDAQARRAEVRERLGTVRDDADRQYQLAVVSMAWQEWGAAATLFEDLRSVVQPRVDALVAARQQDFVAGFYYHMIRNAVLAGDRSRADRLLTDAGVRLMRIDAWRNWMAKDLAGWRDQTFPAAFQEAKRLRVEVEADPSRADALWRLCDLLAHDVPLRLEERQVLRAMMELHPDHPRVADGEALYRSAENALAFREVSYARELYARLKADYPQHPKAKDPSAWGSVSRRLKECEDLEFKMNFRK